MAGHRRKLRIFPTHFPSLIVLLMGRYIAIGIASRSGDRIPVRVTFSTSVQTGPGAHRASYTKGTGYLSLRKSGRRVRTNQPHPVPRLKKKWSYMSAPPLRLRGLL